MATLKAMIFDVNETLLDLAPLRTSVGKALKEREDLLTLWFSTMLHYSLVETLTNNYHDFGQIGAAALMMVAESHGIALEPEIASQSIVEVITKLPAHDDVVPSLQALAAKGFRIVCLTNSSNKGVAAQFDYAGLTELFEQRFSVEDVAAFKPDPRTYQWALKKLGLDPEEVMMIAAHAWDLAGAKAVGLQTAFIQRPGAVLYPHTSRPDYVVENLTQVVKQISFN
ncbi:haloacid dehalogenase type II [Candidatus Nitrotoga sp. M5]|uniref:haloacid dehalogenase type II n=1 Tax=Candidatus Nitrotoga sp. M5 TaxID=2890409 RepID=UPI001EF2AC10|nr:haloacid dehalogenase type II [Candidatus Nitrotoga sp. M5]CAH1385353.1 (S)-2-haloacid dehalogenase [Candidatus Nitrotoga sp. M5]